MALNSKFSSQFCLGKTSEEFDSLNSKELSFKGNVYGFSIVYSPICNSKLLNMRKYLMTKNNIK